MRLKWYKKKLMQKIKKYFTIKSKHGILDITKIKVIIKMFKQIKKYFSRKAKTYKVKKDLYQHVKDNDYEKIKGSYQELEKLL